MLNTYRVYYTHLLLLVVYLMPPRGQCKGRATAEPRFSCCPRGGRGPGREGGRRGVSSGRREDWACSKHWSTPWSCSRELWMALSVSAYLLHGYSKQIQWNFLKMETTRNKESVLIREVKTWKNQLRTLQMCPYQRGVFYKGVLLHIIHVYITKMECAWHNSNHKIYSSPRSHCNFL